MQLPSTVRVGIVSWNTSALLDRCLAALPAALDGLEAEVVVVDNGSGDDSVDVARRHPGVTVDAVGRNLGYGRAMNRALSAGGAADVLIALNPDTVAPPSSLRRLAEALLDSPSAGVVVPRLVGKDGALQHSVYRFPSVAVAAAANMLPVRLLRGRLGRRLWIEGSADHRRGGPVDWAIGAVHVLRAAAAGPAPYDERWFMYAEDLDLCWRLRRQGWTTELVADVEVVHVGNAAGAQRWGTTRTARWLIATYDWYALRRGRPGARAYAATNLVGAALKGVWHAAQRRRWGRELLAVVPVHARAVLRPHRLYAEPE